MDVGHVILHGGDIRKPYGRSIAVGDNQVSVLIGLPNLVVGADGDCFLRAGKLPLRLIGVGAAESGSHQVEADSGVVQLRRIQLCPDGGLSGATYKDLPNALHLRQLLRQDRVGGVVHIRLGNGVRRHRQNHDGRVRRVYFAVGRILRQVGRQGASGGVNGSLHIASGGIDVAIEVELQDDVGRSQLAGRGHLGNARNPPELPFQRSGDGGAHGFRACSGQRSGNRDHRVLDLRQRRDGQKSKSQGTRQQ